MNNLDQTSQMLIIILIGAIIALFVLGIVYIMLKLNRR